MNQAGLANEYPKLNIPEGFVMNKLFQPENLNYAPNETPKYKIACCMLKEEIRITLK